MRPNSREAFKIAFICALAREASAVRAIFDATYDEDGSVYGRQPGDVNSYTTGRVGQHHVVLAHMPRMGETTAASVATNLQRSYPNIQLVLLVGVCGGVPFPAPGVELILGDVVISNGVIECDFGRQYPDRFERKNGWKDALGRPSREVQSLLAKLETDQSRQHLQQRLLYHLDQTQRDDAQYPCTGQDVLFQATYRHKHQDAGSCLCASAGSSQDPVCSRAEAEDCSALGCNQIPIARRRLTGDSPEPLIHIGAIASSNKVLKSGIERDEIATREHVIAYEMEGAGVWDVLPTVIIKGVSDYADSHKNRSWQSYAAMTAAAGAKAFLEYWIPASSAACWSVPFQRNENFVGRAALLDELEQRVLVENRYSKAAIYALGGVGKTAIALELAHRIRHNDPSCSILWVTAINLETFEQSYTDIARKLGLPTRANKSDVLMQVKTYLSDEAAGRWLMILDNADDLAVWYNSNGSSRLADYIPTSPSGSALLTTRTRRVAAKFSPQSMINIHELDMDTSIHLLHNSLCKEPTENTQRLLQELHFLPLAIVQAAAYINENDISIHTYLSLITETEDSVVTMLSKDYEDDWRYRQQKNPVVTTWTVSFEQIRSLSPLAASYLSLMACVSHKAIPKPFLAPKVANADHLEAIALLKSYSFVSQRVDESFEMHRLVQLATRNWLKANDMWLHYLEKVTVQLAEFFTHVNPDNPMDWWALSPHADEVLRLGSDRSKFVGRLTINYGFCLLANGHYQKAVVVCEQGLRAAVHARPGETHDALENYVLAIAYLRQNRPADAEKFLRGIVESHQKRNTDDLKKLKMLELAANIYAIDTRLTGAATKHWAYAERLFSEILEDRRRLQGSEHHDTLITMCNLAVLYRHQRRWRETEAMTFAALDIMSRVLGPEHVQTLRCKINLAAAYRSEGRVAEAMSIYEDVLKVSRRVFGEEDQDTLDVMAGLAWTYLVVGRVQEAEQLKLRVLEVRRRKLGIGNQNTLGSMISLAFLYRDQQRWQEAEQLYAEVLEVNRERLGADHPTTLYTIKDLADVLESQQRWPEALRLREECFASARRVLGEDHSDTKEWHLQLRVAAARASSGV